MELDIRCATWIREEDEKVLEVLRASDRWLTVPELAERTGLPPAGVEHTLKLLKQQLARKQIGQDFFDMEKEGTE